MPSIDAVFVGDLHFDKLKKLFPENHTQLQINELKKPYDYALKNGIENVFLLGDLSEFPVLSVEAFCAFLEFIVSRKNVHTHIIIGNHDFAETGKHSLLPFMCMTDLKLLNNVTFYDKPVTKKLNGVPFNFSPFPHRKGKTGCINLGHFEVSGAIRDNGHKIKEAHDAKEMPWVIGHLHTPHDVGTVHYTGTLYQLSFGESLPKSFTHTVIKERKGKLKIKHKRIPVDPQFKLFNLPIHSKSDLKQIQKNPLYKYKLFIHSSYDLTEDELAKLDNVVDIKGYETKQELKALIENEFVELEEQDLRLPATQDLLKTFLKEKLNRKQIKRGLEIVFDLKPEKQNE